MVTQCMHPPMCMHRMQPLSDASACAHTQVGSLISRTSSQVTNLMAAEKRDPERHVEWGPVQLATLRQRHALCLARLELVSWTNPPSHGHQLPMPLASGHGMRSSGASSGAEDAMAILTPLLRAGHFDTSASLALAYAAEFRRHACLCSVPCGLPLVVAELAAHCVRLDGASGRGGVISLDLDDAMDGGGRAGFASGGGGGGGAVHSEWRRLRRLVEAHDCERVGYELSAAAVEGALKADPSRALPAWLLNHINPPPSGTPLPPASAGGSAAAAPMLLRLSVRAGNTDHEGLPDNGAFARAVNAILDQYRDAQATLCASRPAPWTPGPVDPWTLDPWTLGRCAQAALPRCRRPGPCPLSPGPAPPAPRSPPCPWTPGPWTLDPGPWTLDPGRGHVREAVHACMHTCWHACNACSTCRTCDTCGARMQRTHAHVPVPAQARARHRRVGRRRARADPAPSERLRGSCRQTPTRHAAKRRPRMPPPAPQPGRPLHAVDRLSR